MNSCPVSNAEVLRVSKPTVTAQASSIGKRAYCPRCKRTHWYPADVSAERAQAVEDGDKECPVRQFGDERKLQWLK